MESSGRTLVISDGGVAALVACMAAREALYAGASAAAGAEPAKSGVEAARKNAEATRTFLRDRRPLVFMGELPAGSGAARRKAVERQCAALDLELVEPSPADVPPSGAPAGERATRLLVSAAFAAAKREAARVLWPVHFFDGTDVNLDSVADAIDRALLVTRLLGLDSQPGVRVEVPYADFTDRQLAELAVDLDAPVRTCWWWYAQLAPTPPGDSAGPDEFRAEFHRWNQVLRECGWVQEAGVA